MGCRDEKWKSQFFELVEFKKLKGTTAVPRLANEALYLWCNNQRKMRCGGNPFMTDEKIAMLDDINFIWDVRVKVMARNRSDGESNWKIQYERLVQFKKEHGTTKVSRATNDALYMWCNKQRRLMRQGHESLVHERISLLNEIGFSWGINPTSGPHPTTTPRINDDINVIDSSVSAAHVATAPAVNCKGNNGQLGSSEQPTSATVVAPCAAVSGKSHVDMNDVGACDGVKPNMGFLQKSIAGAATVADGVRQLFNLLVAF